METLMLRVQSRILFLVISLIGLLLRFGNLLWNYFEIYNDRFFVGLIGSFLFIFLFGMLNAGLSGKVLITPLILFCAPALIIVAPGILDKRTLTPALLAIVLYYGDSIGAGILGGKAFEFLFKRRQYYFEQEAK